MAILNYTTTIKAEKSANEIQAMLVNAGAEAVMTQYENKVLTGISFRLMTPGGCVMFRLPANAQGVLKALKSSAKVPRSKMTEEQAQRVAWRIVKDWVEVQVAMIEAQVADLTEVFLPYAQKSDGQTIYESLKNDGFKQLTHQD